MTSISVLLVDDHPVVRAGIRELLEKEPDILVLGEATDGQEALDLVRNLKPDVLLLDMELPGIKGYEVAKQLRSENIPVCILVLSAYSEDHYIQGLFSAGASGYLLKEEIPETIVEAVKGVARGEEGWMSRRVVAQLSGFQQAEENIHSLFKSLSPRELEVLEGVTEGKTNLEIAVQLHISEKTIEKHLYTVYSKLNVISRVEAAVLATRAGWFEKKVKQ